MRNHESYFPNDHGVSFQRNCTKLFSIVGDHYTNSYLLFLPDIQTGSGEMRLGASRSLFFLFTNALFLVEVEVRSFTMIRPSGLYPSLQRKLTQTKRVSFLLFAALISLHLFRAVRAASSSPSLLLLRPFSNAYSRTLPSVHRFPFSTLLSISSPFARAHRPYPIAIFLARPSIFLRTVSLAPLQGNRPNADAAGAHPAKIAPLSRRPIRPGTYVRTSATFAIGNFPPFRTN